MESSSATSKTVLLSLLNEGEIRGSEAVVFVRQRVCEGEGESWNKFQHPNLECGDLSPLFFFFLFMLVGKVMKGLV